MTEPIAVDMPGKPMFPRSAPLSVSVPSPSSVPASPKPEAPKPASMPELKVPVAVPPISALPPLAPASLPSAGWLAHFTRKQLIIGATAILSTGVGIGGIRLVFPPAKDEPNPILALPPTKDEPNPIGAKNTGEQPAVTETKNTNEQQTA